MTREGVQERGVGKGGKIIWVRVREGRFRRHGRDASGCVGTRGTRGTRRGVGLGQETADVSFSGRKTVGRQLGER